MKRYFLLINKTIIFTLLTGCISSQTAFAHHIATQQTLPILNNQFHYINGSWSSYIIFDKINFTYSYVDIAIRNNESCMYPSGCVWIEIRVRLIDQPVIVTRILTNKGESGPNYVLKAAVWIDGYKPFWIPKGLLDEDDGNITKFAPTYVPKCNGTKIARLNGKLVTLSRVVSEENTVTAYIAREVAPLGIVALEAPHINMYLVDWGFHKGSWMPQEPVSFYWWIMEQILNSVDEKD